jgi:thiol-disulfide isomerase/thioredoxin/uncharacterized membrane protein YphA (DoxX/SURF4 family)
VPALLLSARCVLAAVFLVAAAGKLRDLPGARRALEEFGVPKRLSRLGSRALPAVELSVVVALVIRPSAVWGAWGALLLLLTFTVAIARALSQGRAPDCHCFGQIHAEPAGPSSLIRNAALAAPAALILAAGDGPSLDGGLRSLDATQLALVATGVLALALALATAQLWSDKRRLTNELQRARAGQARPGLSRGAPAPEFALTAVSGGAASLDELRRPARPLALIFLSTHCGPCLEMLPMLAGWQEALVDSVTVASIFSGDIGDIRRVCQENGLGSTLAQETDETFTAYALRVTPSGVLIDRQGAIASAPAEGAPAIEALIRSATAN